LPGSRLLEQVAEQTDGAMPGLLGGQFSIQELPKGFSLVGFAQSENPRSFAVPPNPVPKSFTVPAHDLERVDRTLVPVFDLSQDRVDILS
jgi:hypothetical protein